MRDRSRAPTTTPFACCISRCSRITLHAIVEADKPAALTAGIRSLAIRIALAVKRVARVRKVWGDRYHARPSARAGQHRSSELRPLVPGLGATATATERPFTDPPCPARTWLAAVGWRRSGGLIDPREAPLSPRKIAR
jgi:hypothetical protein